MEERGRMQKNIKYLFIIRICLWVTAIAATIYWIWYSIKLHMEEIFEPEEFARLFKPVFYRCLIIAVTAIGISFALYAISKKVID